MKIEKAIFLSHLINERIPVYGGKKSVRLQKVKSIKNGDSCNTMFWSFPNHAGTHVDAPLHFKESGVSISGLRPSDLIFNKINLIKIRGIGPGYMIGIDDLKGVRDCDLLLISTGSERHRNKDIYWKDSIALSPELAPWLKKRCPSLRAIGIDTISISNLNRRELGRKAHKAFLGRDILLIEDMKLGGLEKKPNSVIVAPILAEKADGAPCTVLGLYN